MQKEERNEKRQWNQQKYEVEICYETEKLLTLVPEQNRTELRRKIEELTDRTGAAAFMDGYRYALAILQDSMPEVE